MSINNWYTRQERVCRSHKWVLIHTRQEQGLGVINEYWVRVRLILCPTIELWCAEWGSNIIWMDGMFLTDRGDPKVCLSNEAIHVSTRHSVVLIWEITWTNEAKRSKADINIFNIRLAILTLTCKLAVSPDSERSSEMITIVVCGVAIWMTAALSSNERSRVRQVSSAVNVVHVLTNINRHFIYHAFSIIGKRIDYFILIVSNW